MTSNCPDVPRHTAESTGTGVGSSPGYSSRPGSDAVNRQNGSAPVASFAKTRDFCAAIPPTIAYASQDGPEGLSQTRNGAGSPEIAGKAFAAVRANLTRSRGYNLWAR